MKKLILYSYSKCSTCRKALKWLDQKGFDYALKDIVNEPPSKNYINLALKIHHLDKKKVFNTRGKKFRSINLDINTLADQKIIQLLQNDGKLVKRPFLVVEEKKIILGFNEHEYNDFLEYKNT